MASFLDKWFYNTCILFYVLYIYLQLLIYINLKEIT